MRIDAHQHFWSLERGDYGWLTPDLAPLYRDFGPDDLAVELTPQGIDGTVLVQAAPTLAETHFMLGIAEATPTVLGVVGWVDFEDPVSVDVIRCLAKNPKLVGLRPMIQDIADDDWMLKPNLASAFEAIIDTGLVFDALTLPRHLDNLSTLLARYPALRVVIDHGSKPEIATRQFDPWAQAMARLAAETTASVKLSGLVTEATADWSTEDLKPYVDHLIASFGPDRIIWGSDWPVCTLASSYDRWVKTTDTLLSALEPQQKAAIQGLNAAKLYQLEIPT